MQVIPLAVVPNQKFTIRLDDIRWTIKLQLTQEVMSATIERNGVPVVSGARCVAGEPLINYRASEDRQGNFIFVTLNDELPMYTQFNTTQVLQYYSNAELEVIRDS